jgi:sodium/potassium-transporting ATPase subunit alpha
VCFPVLLRISDTDPLHLYYRQAEAIARKINLILGDTRESLAEKTGRCALVHLCLTCVHSSLNAAFTRPLNDIYDDEVPAIVIHGDRIDSLLVSLWLHFTVFGHAVSLT